MTLRRLILAIGIGATLAGAPLAQAQAPAQPAPIRLDDPMDFALMTGHGPQGEARWIQAWGMLTEGAAGRYAAVVRENPGAPLTVVFNSSGGDVSAALALGRAIRGAGARTTVGLTAVPAGGAGEARLVVGGASCRGACALAFLGGLERRLPAGADLQFHRRGFAYPDGGPRAATDPSLAELGRMQQEAASVARYILEMGIDPVLIREMAEVEADAAGALLNAQTLARLRVATRASEDGPPTAGWLRSPRPDTPFLIRRVRLIERAERPVDAEFSFACHHEGRFEWWVEILMSDATADDRARLRALRLGTRSQPEIARPVARDALRYVHRGFHWGTFLAPRTAFDDVGETGLVLTIEGPDGWSGRTDVADGLAGALVLLARDCDSYLARPGVPANR